MNRDKRVVFSILIGVLFFSFACSNPAKTYAKHMERAQVYMDTERYDEARIELLNALKLKPDSTEAYSMFGYVSIEQGNAGSAAKAFRNVLDLKPDNLEAAQAYGELLVAVKAYEEAEKVLMAGLEHNPKDTRLLALLSMVQAHLGKLLEAEITAKEVVELKPEDKSSWLNLAGVYLLSNRPWDTEKALLKAEAIAPEDEQIIRARVDFLRRSGRLEEAIDVLEKHVSNHPDNWALQVQLGELLFAAGKVADAKKTFEVALEEKEDAHVLNKLGIVLIQSGDEKGAVAAWKKSIELDERLPDPHINLARVYLSRNESKTALEHVESVFKLDKEHPVGLALEGEILRKEGKYVEAAANLEKALKQSAGEKWWKLSLAKSRIGMGQTISAKNLLNEIIREEQDNHEAALLLSKIEYRLGSIDDASKHAMAVSRDPLFAVEAMWILGDVRMLKKQPEKAEGIYRRALSQYQPYPGTRIRLAMSLEAQNETREASEIYRSLIQENVDDIKSLRRLVGILVKEKRPAKARELIEQIGVYGSPERAILYGMLLESSGDRSGAEKTYLSLIEKEPQYFPAYSRLVGFYFQAGELDKAETWLKKSLEDQEKGKDGLQLMLGMIQDVRGDREAAIESYRAVLEINPDMVLAMNNLAWALAESGSLDEALEVARRARGIDDQNPYLGDTYGWILHQKGDSVTAIQVLKDAMDKLPRHKEIRSHLVTVLNDLGRKEEANRYLNENIPVVSPDNSPE